MAGFTLLAAASLAFIPLTSAGAAQAPVGLATAESFAVLAGAGITNTGATTINGDVGTFPTPTETGFGSVTLNGVNHAADSVTQQAKAALTTAYIDATGRLPETAVPTELGNTTLTPGVYTSNTLGITGTLTLDTLGDPNAVFIFKTNSTLITAANSNVNVINSSIACNVFWRVPSSATLGANSHLVGTVLASTAITLNNQATVNGRVFADTASVTMQNNTITTGNCASALPTTTTSASTTTTLVPSGGSPTTTTAVASSPTAGTTTTTASTGASLGAAASGATGTGTSRTTVAKTGRGDSSNARRRSPLPRTPALAHTGLNDDLVFIATTTSTTGIVLLLLSASLRRRRATS